LGDFCHLVVETVETPATVSLSAVAWHMPTCYVDFNAKRHQYFLPPQIPLGKLTSLSALPYPMYGRGGRERRRWGRKRGGKDKGEEREYMEAR